VLLTEEDFSKTMSDDFREVTSTAQDFNPQIFDRYVNENLVSELGVMQIELVYESSKLGVRHVIFATERKNVKYIVIIDLSAQEIKGHFVLNLNDKYGIK